eukprot:TRINITY_DN1494_c0_g1_i2.p1 TRINITY_DN1494_c0_g1~~TRINITY_DN1494_c0_g1_i2.p1  ORF type:complete len:459 (+),score=133.80 TRINITY_DN1494_c0_g1_i2:164-1378(+)
MRDGKVSHCFHVNGQQNPEVAGVEGILHAYRSSFTNGVIATLYGPTNFAPIVNVASKMAKELHANSADVQAYLILLILTDGEITDMEDTVAAIVEASYLPMSIVIVGVGPADFTKMNILDGDERKLKAAGRECLRDIVQFVPYRDFKRGPPGALSTAVLAEIPGQFMDYMQKNKIAPQPPPDEKEIAKLQQLALQRNMSYIPSDIEPPPPMVHQQQEQVRHHQSVMVNYPPGPQNFPQQPLMTQQPAGYPQPQPGGYPPQPQPAGGYPPQPQPGGFPPQPAGGYPPQPQPGGFPPQPAGGYPPQPQPGGFPPQQQGGFPPQQQGGGFPPQQQGGGFPPQQQGGFPPQQPLQGFPPQQQGGGFPPQQQGGGFPPQQQGGFPPQQQPQQGGNPHQQQALQTQQTHG